MQAAHADTPPTLTPLGYLSGATSAYSWQEYDGITPNGSVVVGSSYDSTGNDHAFRWTQAGGMVDLGTLGGSVSNGNGVSSDGSVVVGASLTSADTYWQAFRWTQAGGMQDLGTLGGNYSGAKAVSADGSVVVGWATTSGDNFTNAFRWTQGTGMVDIDNVGGTNSAAVGVSADGSVVVGEAQFTGGNYDAFRWTQDTGMVDLGNFGETNASTNGYASRAFGVSADGSTIVGNSSLPITAPIMLSAGRKAPAWSISARSAAPIPKPMASRLPARLSLVLLKSPVTAHGTPSAGRRRRACRI